MANQVKTSELHKGILNIWREMLLVKIPLSSVAVSLTAGYLGICQVNHSMWVKCQQIPIRSVISYLTAPICLQPKDTHPQKLLLHLQNGGRQTPWFLLVWLKVVTLTIFSKNVINTCSCLHLNGWSHYKHMPLVFLFLSILWFSLQEKKTWNANCTLK